MKAFKQNTLPLSILEERDVEMEAEELYIPAEVLKAWREEMEGKLKELEKILASTSSEELDSFLAQNPEMQSASKVPLSQFVKALHKDVEMPSQNLGEKFEANDVADEEKTDEADSQNGYYVSISYEDALAELDKSNKHYAQSVRCVKNP